MITAVGIGIPFLYIYLVAPPAPQPCDGFWWAARLMAVLRKTLLNATYGDNTAFAYPPVPLDEMTNVDAVIVTHTHPDHRDEAAKSIIAKDTLIFVQDASDEAELRSAGFTNTQVLTQTTEFQGVSMAKTPGQHGSDHAVAMMPEMLSRVCGIVFRHPDEKTLYIAGDTLWNEHVRTSIEKYSPQVIAVNCGDARVDGLGSIIMGKEDVHEVHNAAPQAVLIACHMEAVNHCVLSRNELREYSTANEMTERLLVPEDCDSYML